MCVAEQSADSADATIRSIVPGESDMDGPVLKVGVGLIEQMSAVEAELLQQGFNRVPAGIDPSNLVAKQYAKREVVADGDIPQKPITSVILMWRE